MSTQKISNYHEFWPFYVSEHLHPMSRRLHFTGTTLSLIFLVAAMALQEPWLVLCAVVSGYAFAWVGHFFVEKNRPATFTYPVWSLISDFRMFYLILTGRMNHEIERLGLKKTA